MFSVFDCTMLSDFKPFPPYSQSPDSITFAFIVYFMFVHTLMVVKGFVACTCDMIWLFNCVLEIDFGMF